jgi:ketosteroid isomerase-like protein
MEAIMERTTQQVFESHEAAFQSGDMDKLMADYADDAVMLLLDNVAVGKEAIRALYMTLIAGFPGLKVSFGKRAVEGDLFLVQYSGDSDVATIPHGVTTFIIQDGKIQRQTEWFIAVPKDS